MTAPETLGDALTRVSGIPRTEMTSLWEEVKENHRRLAECDYHTFTDITPDNPLNKKYRCNHCQGEIDSRAYYWFMRGLAHGNP